MNDRPAFPERLLSFPRRHPLIWDAFRWAIPALLFGAFLRVLLTSYMPYAFWNADSRSFYLFAQKFLLNGSFSLGEKRRYLYPLLMLPISYLPGGPLRWLPVFQHALGLLTLVPLAYVVRKTLVLWRAWIIPITVIYAGLPIVVWCEHELLGDHLFFVLLIWMFAGWMAWVTQTTPARARRLFWAFLVPFALFIITKPSGRLVWPGLLIGLLLVKAWQRLSWQQGVALLAILVITPTVGSKKQGAWLFYDAAFPLTQLDTPLHAEYKAGIRESVESLRSDLDIYHAVQEGKAYYFLRDPGKQDGFPLWQALGKDEKLKNKIYTDLALEGVKARPDLFLYLGLQKVVFDANLSIWGASRFEDGTFVKLTEEYYTEAEQDEGSPLRLAFGLPRHGPVPPYAEFQKKLEPAPGSWPAWTVRAIVGAYGTKFDFFNYHDLPYTHHKLSLTRPTFLGCWMGVALALTLLPRYRKTLGVWMIISMIYLFGVYIISVVNVHYIAPIWPVLFVIMAVPADIILAQLFQRRVAAPEVKTPGPAH